MSDIVVFGAQKLAELARFYFEHDTEHKVVAFTVNQSYMKDREIHGLPLVPFETVHEAYPPDRFMMFVAIGYKEMNKNRAQKCREAREKGYQLPTFVCTNAVAWPGVEIGGNCLILESVILEPFVKVGEGVVICGGTHLGHNTVLGSHCWISPHATLCGGVKVGDCSFVGANVTVRDNVLIGRECIIGAGSTLLNDVQDREVYVCKPTEKYPLNSADFSRMTDISR